MIAYSLHFTWFCCPSCRQTWEWFPIWRVAPADTAHKHARAQERGEQEWECDRRGFQEPRFPSRKTCLPGLYPHSLSSPPGVHRWNKVITLWPWRFGLALSWTLVGRKDWADRHTSKGDTFFNLGFKKNRKKFKPKPRRTSFVMSIVFKNVIWPELEVLQMKNNLALFSPFACRFQLCP